MNNVTLRQRLAKKPPHSRFDSFLSESAFRSPERLVPSTWHGHAPFAFWLVERLAPRILVQFGISDEFSYFTLCQAIQMAGLNSAAFAVDDVPGVAEKTYRSVENYSKTRYSKISTLLRWSIKDTLRYFEDGSIDLLHVNLVSRNIDIDVVFDNWRSKLSARAIVLLHGINLREPGITLSDFWSKISTHYPHFSFIHGDGLGVLAVGTDYSPPISDFFNASKNAALAANIRNAYERLGATVNLTFAEASRSRIAWDQEIRRRQIARDQLEEKVVKLEGELLRQQKTLIDRNQFLDTGEMAAFRGEIQTLRGCIEELTEKSELQKAERSARSDVNLDQALTMLSAERQRAAELSDRIAALECEQKEFSGLCTAKAEEVTRDKERLAIALAASEAECGALLIENARCTFEFDDLQHSFDGVQTQKNDLLMENQLIARNLKQRESEIKLLLDDQKELAEELGKARATLAELLARVDHVTKNNLKLSEELEELSTRQNRNRFLHGDPIQAREIADVKAFMMRQFLDATHVQVSVMQTLQDSFYKLVPPLRRRLEARHLLRSGLLDQEFYVSTYQDVSQSNLRPTEHFLLIGFFLGYRPNVLFDTCWYLEKYRDVLQSGVNPLLHYLMYGWREGRDPGPNFRTAYYLEQYADVKVAGVNPLIHYLSRGQREGRHPLPPVERDTTAEFTG